MGGVYERLREAARSPESVVDLQSNPDNSSPRPESGIASSGNPKAKNYTYDMKSSRRIDMSRGGRCCREAACALYEAKCGGTGR